MKSRANYKEYILDTILMLVIVQLSRIITKYILLSQLKLTLANIVITSIVSFIIIGTFLFLLLKNNEKFNPTNIKIINMFNQTSKYIRIALGISIGFSLIIKLLLNGGLKAYNIEIFTLSIIIIPIFEELLFREYIWNYLTNYIKNTAIVFIAVTIIYAIYQIGYMDIIKQYVYVTNSPVYIIDILTTNIFKALVLGFITGFSKLKFKDTSICMLLHGLFSILFY